MVNAVRVIAVTERLSAYFKAEAAWASSQIPNSMEYSNLLLSPARGIDYSIASNETPPRADELPKVLNKIRRRKTDACSQGIVLVLMISVKMHAWPHSSPRRSLRSSFLMPMKSEVSSAIQEISVLELVNLFLQYQQFWPGGHAPSLTAASIKVTFSSINGRRHSSTTDPSE